MRAGEFLINGESSIDKYGTRLQTRFDLETPARRSELVQAMGQDGYSIIDEEAYDDTKVTLVVVIEPLKGHDRSAMRNLLTVAFTGSGGYIPFVPYHDDKKTYFVRLDGDSKINFRNKYMYGDVLEATIPINVKPWKELNGYNASVNPTSMDNPASYAAKPLISVTMSGSTGSFSINGVTYNLANANSSETIHIDCDRFIAYNMVNGKITALRNTTLLFKDFPVLIAGKNTISKSGGVSSMSITPRWRVLV
jgi:phage-related protein